MKASETWVDASIGDFFLVYYMLNFACFNLIYALACEQACDYIASSNPAMRWGHLTCHVQRLP